MTDLINSTIIEIHNLLLKKKLSVKELVELSFKNIDKFDNKINSFITLNKENALKKAEIIDKKIHSGIEIKPLEGIPYSSKDVFSTKGIRTTCGSKILENYIPDFDATVIEKLDKNG